MFIFCLIIRNLVEKSVEDRDPDFHIYDYTDKSEDNSSENSSLHHSNESTIILPIEDIVCKPLCENELVRVSQINIK